MRCTGAGAIKARLSHTSVQPSQPCPGLVCPAWLLAQPMQHEFGVEKFGVAARRLWRNRPLACQSQAGPCSPGCSSHATRCNEKLGDFCIRQAKDSAMASVHWRDLRQLHMHAANDLLNIL